MSDEHYIKRCLQLARLGEGYVAPNPMVGALLLHDNVIIGEGYHQLYGGPHAEVNCLRSVSNENKHLVPLSSLYVSLEPCAHYGKTPPCVDLIIREKIKKVIIACVDPFAKVNGLGVGKLTAAGIAVKDAVLELEARELNKRFFYFHNKKRPYIFLKWAQTNDGFIAGTNFGKQLISNEVSNRLTHHLRSTEAAIMVGTNTAMYDQPSLTSRLWPGKNPLRIVIDKHLQLLATAAIFKDDAQVVVINYIKDGLQNNIRFLKINPGENLITIILTWLYENNITSLIVEGGTKLLQAFIDENAWNEAIVISNKALNIGTGIAAPLLPAATQVSEFKLRTDYISIHKNK